MLQMYLVFSYCYALFILDPLPPPPPSSEKLDSLQCYIRHLSVFYCWENNIKTCDCDKFSCLYCNSRKRYNIISTTESFISDNLFVLRSMFYITTHSTHFIYGFMTSGRISLTTLVYASNDDHANRAI